MLNYSKTIFTQTASSIVATGLFINEEGSALVISREGSNAVVGESTGAAGEIFAGFSYERTRRPTILSGVYEAHIADEQPIELHRIPDPGSIGVWVDGKKLDIDAGKDAPSLPDSVSLNGHYILVHKDHVGKNIKVQFLYQPTVLEALTYGDGNDFDSTPASAYVGVVGRILGGSVSTNYFDVEADWSDESVMHPSLGLDGRLTIGGSGTKLTNLVIIQSPASESAFLTLEFIR
jgi:hypothetical protein